MRIKLEYIEVMMLIEGLDAMHLPTSSHDEVKKSLKPLGDVAAGTGKDFNELAVIFPDQKRR